MVRRANAVPAVVPAILMLILTCSGVAHAGGRHERWSAVKKLAPGVPVEVERQGQAGVEDCLMVSADDASLTCRRDPDPNTDWGPGSNARVVFPRDAVREVWVIEPGEGGRHIGGWIAAGVSVGLVAAASVGGGVIGGVIVGGMVIGAWSIWNENPIPYRGPRQPRWHRQLVYRSATP